MGVGAPQKTKAHSKKGGPLTVFAGLEAAQQRDDSPRWLPPSRAGNGMHADSMKLQQSAFKTSADAAEAGTRAGAAPRVTRTVVQAVFAVKPADVSKVVDANGETLIAYQGTGADQRASGPLP